VTTVRDEKARRIACDESSLHELYTETILPEAMAANERILSALAEAHTFDAPAGLEDATRTGDAGERRYAQDVLRELHYQDCRRHLTELATRTLTDAKMNDLRSLNTEQREKGRNSQTAWKLIRRLADLDMAYGQGDYDRAVKILADVATLREVLE
jgi:hypothetical protein